MPQIVDDSQPFIGWSAGGNVELKKGVTYEIKLTRKYSTQNIIGLLLSAGSISTIRYKSKFKTETKVEDENRKRYRYCVFNTENEKAYCTVVNPYTGLKSAQFPIEEIAPGIKEEFVLLNNCGTTSTQNCELFQNPISSGSPNRQIKITRRIIRINGIICQKNTWHIIATFAQQISQASVDALLLTESFDTITSFQYRNAIFSATGIYYTENETRNSLIKKLRQSTIEQFVIQLDVLSGTSQTLPFTVRSLKSISTVFSSLYHNVHSILRYSYINEKILLVDMANNLIAYDLTSSGEFINGTYLSTNTINTLPLTDVFSPNNKIKISSALKSCVSLGYTSTPAPGDFSLVNTPRTAVEYATLLSQKITWGSSVRLTIGWCGKNGNVVAAHGIYARKASRSNII